MQNRLYVGNLAGEVTANTLQELFETHGFVMDVKLETGREGGAALRFAFVTMATDASARAAMRALNGAGLHGVVIKVEEARAEEAGGRAGQGCGRPAHGGERRIAMPGNPKAGRRQGGTLPDPAALQAEFKL